ncbi:uncharacterized protein, partial [Spinacia oleracea]
DEPAAAPEINHKKLNLEPETSSVNNKEETDGFETASEGDHSDRGTDFGDDEQQQQEKFAPLTAVKDDSYEDALDDDQLKQGKYDETVKECSKAIELNPAYVKALLRRGEAYEKLERYEEAISDMKKILEVEASNEQARRNIVRMEPLAREKAEKMKEEMIGNLFLLHTSADPLLYLHSPL